jgi:nitroimidazol reductase NimA-like FMN-containing flavoprotein (pyridoxamine 5'-phosphate oxidase superfamily)
VADTQFEPLDQDECFALLAAGVIGRIGFISDGLPVVLPINFRLVRSTGVTPGTWVAVRTRPGNVIDEALRTVAFEIDGHDPESRSGWSVLVQGELFHIDSGSTAIRAQFDSDPWLVDERDAWLLIQPFSVTGRRLHLAPQDWALDHRPG